MAKRKKYPKLPNGFGSIKFLGKNRRNPYAVHPPVEKFTLDGIPITPKALCYVNDWMVGFAVLTAYKSGTYTKGMEVELSTIKADTDANTIAQAILADYSRSKTDNVQEQAETFSEIYEKFYDYKYNQDKSRTYSDSTKRSTCAAYKHCEDIHNKVFKDLRHTDLQSIIDNCPLKHASLEFIVTLYHQMFQYAIIYELVDKDYSAFVKINTPDDDEHGDPFTENDLKILWANRSDPVVAFILIMCYSGYRISAYKGLEVNIKKGYFKGGVKTAAGKNRVVPIHARIRNLVRLQIKKYGKLMPDNIDRFRIQMREKLRELNIQDHTPHDCRHTFSMLCEKYKVNDNDRKRMLGHSFGSDITNGIYGHRSLEDLRGEIGKIKVCY